VYANESSLAEGNDEMSRERERGNTCTHFYDQVDREYCCCGIFQPTVDLNKRLFKQDNKKQ